MACKHFQTSFSDAAFSKRIEPKKKRKKHISVCNQRLTSTVRIQQIFRTHVGLAEQFSEKYKRKIFPKKSTRHKRKSQSSNLSLRLRDHRSGDVYYKLGDDNDCVKKTNE